MASDVAGADAASARDLGAGHVATGHYARIVSGESGPRLARGLDASKDQSYFLASVPYRVLEECLFPVGGLEKSEVRALAAEAGLPVAQKGESQEICFVPNDDYRLVLRKHAPEVLAEGAIVDEEGRRVGTHDGYAGFTVGQRRGLGVAAGEPRYVIRTDRRSNEVVIGPRSSLERDRFRVSEMNWLLPEPPPLPLECSVQIRYRGEPSPCEVTARPDGTLDVRLRDPRFAIAAGQVAAFYDGDVIIGGGWIEPPAP